MTAYILERAQRWLVKSSWTNLTAHLCHMPVTILGESPVLVALAPSTPPDKLLFCCTISGAETLCSPRHPSAQPPRSLPCSKQHGCSRSRQAASCLDPAWGPGPHVALADLTATRVSSFPGLLGLASTACCAGRLQHMLSAAGAALCRGALPWAHCAPGLASSPIADLDAV